MRIAALYDIHGNLPALDAVLAEVEAAAPDMIVIGGDVATGPLPAETLDRLADLGERARFVMGNADRELVQAYDSGADPEALEDPVARLDAWCAQRLTRGHRDQLAAFEPLVRAASTLFCHGSPRSDTEMITALTPEDRLAPMLADVAEPVVVCGHTHHQFDLRAAGRRVVNAGSVGMPYEDEAAAYWLVLDAEPQLRRTDYDIEQAAEQMRAAGFDDLDEMMLRESLLEPVGRDAVARFFEDRATE